MAVLTLVQAGAFADHLRSTGQRLVVADGPFDLLLPAHVRALEVARVQGDALLVLVHADRGAHDTGLLITPEHERAEIVAALASVDAVVVVAASAVDFVAGRLEPAIRAPGLDRMLETAESVSLMTRIRGR